MGLFSKYADGVHAFEQVIIEDIAPTPNASDVESIQYSSGVVNVISSLHSRKYAYCCKYCGKWAE